MLTPRSFDTATSVVSSISRENGTSWMSVLSSSLKCGPSKFFTRAWHFVWRIWNPDLPSSSSRIDPRLSRERNVEQIAVWSAILISSLFFFTLGRSSNFLSFEAMFGWCFRTFSSSECFFPSACFFKSASWGLSSVLHSLQNAESPSPVNQILNSGIFSHSLRNFLGYFEKLILFSTTWNNVKNTKICSCVPSIEITKNNLGEILTSIKGPNKLGRFLLFILVS